MNPGEAEGVQRAGEKTAAPAPSGGRLTLRSPCLQRLLESCQGPAFWIDADGRVVLANPAAVRLFPELAGLASPTASTAAGPRERPKARQLLGLGWRELLPLARDGGSELLLKLPVAAARGGRDTRVTLEPILDGEGVVSGLLLLLEPLAGRSRYLDRGPRGAVRGQPAVDPFATLFGSDGRLREAIELARRFAPTSLPILLLAETGTGKDLLARAIHAASPRGAGPYVAINCGGLSPHLLESELFGYAPGAFTGARREGQEGKLGAADGGTLFLDEVAEMPRALQAVLLRFLEDGTFYRVGDNRPRQADVRLICATCRDLKRRVEDGSFRRDLYYRVKGACLTLPPLRERDDVEELTAFLLGSIGASRPDREAPSLSRQALGWIRGHPWHGNVRELKNALRHAVALADEEIRLEHLPVEEPTGPAPEPGGRRASRSGAGRTSLREVERAAVRHAIDAADGNLSAAARALGVARSTLYRLLDRHGIDPEPR